MGIGTDDTAADSSVPPSRPSGDGGPSPFDPPPAASRFAERAELGRGGMGRVFEALDTALDRQVAIKQSLADDPDILARFEREVRITARLQHPGIVPILDAGRDAQGRPYYVMRRIEGRPLAEATARATTVEERLALVPNVLAAVDAAAYAHSRGVIHRDIKPWNVLVGPFGETLLIDWGLARELATTTRTLPPEDEAAQEADELTRAGATYGTPGFMPPEQARGEVLDRRADVFALGATLYHTLTGRRPLEGASPTQAIDLARSGELPRRLPAQVPAELAAIVAKAMAPERADRYPNAGALADDLRRFTTGQLVAAHHYTARDLIARWLKRHRIAVAIAGIAMVVLAVVAVVSVRRVIAARDAEAVRSDELVLEHAQSLAFRDPTRAVAMLRGLRTDSPELWRRASAVFDSAIARGVARGRHAHPGAISANLAASPAGDRVVSVGSDGAVVLHDPKLLEEPRRIATIPGAYQVEWPDAEAIVVTNRAATVFVVKLDGTVKEVARKVRRLVEPRGGRGFLLAQDGELREIDLGRGVKFEPVKNVQVVARLTKAMVYVTKDAAIFHPDGGEPHTFATGIEPIMIAHSIDDQRIAIGYATETVEWSLETGTPVESARWNVTTLGLLYVHHTLLAQELTRAVWLSPDRDTMVATGLFGTMGARIAGAPCSYLSTTNGGLWQACLDGVTQVAGRAEKLVSLAFAGDQLVGTTTTGRMMSWNLAASRPERISLPRGLVPSALVDGHVVNQSGNVQTFDTTSGRVIEIGAGVFRCKSRKYGVFTTMGDDHEGTFVVEYATGRKVRIGSSTMSQGCSRYDRIGVIDGKRIDLRDLSNPLTSIKTVEAPFDVAAVHLEGDWLVAGDRGDRFARINARTGAVDETRVADSLYMAIDSKGRVAVVGDREVTVWDLDGAKTTEPISSPTSMTINPAGIVITTRDTSLVVISEDGVVHTFHQASGRMPSVAIDAPYAVMAGAEGELGVIDLRDGRLRLIPSDVAGAVISADGSQVLGWVGRHGMIWKVPAERTRAELVEAIDAATNATIDPNSARVVFDRPAVPRP